jgi:Mg-chelatase subunit ChlD
MSEPTKVDPASLGPEDRRTLARWRVVLGREAESCGICATGDEDLSMAGQLLDELYTGSSGRGGRGGGQRTGGLGGGHAMDVPRWVDAVTELFPRQAKEILERELVRRRGIAELLDRPDVLERVEPSVELVKTLLTHRDLMNEKTRGLARKIIEKVVRELQEKLKVQVQPAITGAIRRDKHSPRKVVRNVDLRTTVRRNLKNWDEGRGKLLVDRVWFHAAERNARPWHVIVAVDQSGSMLESAVFSAVMASIFAQLPSVRTSLFLFDTEIADLSDRVGEPVDVLLSVQLGGGTHIAKAVRYAGQLIREPARSIVVLITDFYEGGSESDLVREVKLLAESGVRMIGLGALGYDARPEYHKQTAARCRKVGMDILVCTPEKLADAMAQIIRG